MRVWTVGHSNRSTAELVDLLEPAGIAFAADVRRYPASRRHPHFAREALETSLGKRGIGYRWFGESLGGRRQSTVPVESSPNRGWTEPAFRCYADAIATPDFEAAVEKLEALARSGPTALLCAEAVWWRCHRRILADVLVVRGWEVLHLLSRTSSPAHELSEWARVDSGVLTYPALL